MFNLAKILWDKTLPATYAERVAVVKNTFITEKHEVYIFETNYFLTDKRHQLKLEKSYKRQSNDFLIYYII